MQIHNPQEAEGAQAAHMSFEEAPLATLRWTETTSGPKIFSPKFCLGKSSEGEHLGHSFDSEGRREGGRGGPGESQEVAFHFKYRFF